MTHMQTPAGTYANRIVLVTDRPEQVSWLKPRVEAVSNCELTGIASPQEALRRVPFLHLDLLIVHLFREGDGFHLLRQLANRPSTPPVLILEASDEDSPDRARHALMAGAMGYLTLEEAEEQLEKALTRMLSGEIYLSANMKSGIHTAYA